jgi:hypothetical protein
MFHNIDKSRQERNFFMVLRLNYGASLFGAQEKNAQYTIEHFYEGFTHIFLLICECLYKNLCVCT